MQFDRKTINLILQIKRTLPEEQKSTFNLTAPNLLEQIRDIHHTSSRRPTKELTQAFFDLVADAGISDAAEKQTMYRGSPIAKAPNTASKTNKQAKASLMYRGQPVDA